MFAQSVARRATVSTRDLDPTPTGYAIENYWYSHSTSNRTIMAIYTLLRRFVVIGSDQEGGIRAKPFRLPRQRDRLRRWNSIQFQQ